MLFNVSQCYGANFIVGDVRALPDQCETDLGYYISNIFVLLGVSVRQGSGCETRFNCRSAIVCGPSASETKWVKHSPAGVVWKSAEGRTRSSAAIVI
ncbi:hypothetical protein AVEN_101368-1 [Araneus ventricosus]|uniref:Uncharacterized protein n=1 Tax=Araneus ventricosus TaxID=182803 RepID=A0A4Y2MQJ5_ARAVE|nr:hypothetical protein AVEN_101368-1 [Araneus ventricosus]